MIAAAGNPAAHAGHRPAELIGIQYLRGAAAMMVVVFHLETHLRRMGYSGFWPSGLAGGVDLFFVISGFIMWTTTAGRQVGPLTFWKRRIARIVPLYWLVTTTVVVIMLVAPSVLRSSRFSPAHVVASYLFIPWDHPVLHVLWPVVTPGWTLNYEMFFYLVFGLFLLARPPLRLAGTTLTLLALTAAGWAAAPGHGPIAFYTDDVLLEFAGGILLGAIATRSHAMARRPLPVIAASIVGGIGYVLIVPELTASHSRFLTMGIGAIATVAGVVALERRGAVRRIASLRLLGDASYSLYLSQQITIAAATAAWKRAALGSGTGGELAYCVFATTIATLTGIAIYLVVERRIVRWSRPRPVVAAAA